MQQRNGTLWCQRAQAVSRAEPKPGGNQLGQQRKILNKRNFKNLNQNMTLNQHADSWGTRGAPSVKCMTLDLSSGHDQGCESKPHAGPTLGSTLGVGSTLKKKKKDADSLLVTIGHCFLKTYVKMTLLYKPLGLQTHSLFSPVYL